MMIVAEELGSNQNMYKKAEFCVV